MADHVITKQELIDAKRDARDLGKAVNEKVIVSPRYGEDFKSIPLIVEEGEAKITQAAQTITNATASILSQKDRASELIIQAESDVVTAAADVHQRGNQEIINLQNAIDIAAAAGAGKNGWTALLVRDASGKTQQDINNAFIGVNTIADLLAIGSPFNGMRVPVKGYRTPTLFVEANPYKGGGTFFWDAASTATPDNGIVFAVDGIATGRWIRQVEDYHTPEMFGARATGLNSDDDYAAIMAATSAAFRDKKYVYFPSQFYYSSETINLKVLSTWVGESTGQASGIKTTIRFADNKDGIVINRHNTNGATGTTVSTTGADGSFIKGIAVEQLNYPRITASSLLDFNINTSQVIGQAFGGRTYLVGDIVYAMDSDFGTAYQFTIDEVVTTNHVIGLSINMGVDIGAIVTGATSGATAKVAYVSEAYAALVLTDVVGNFAVGESVTSGAMSAVITVKNNPAVTFTIYKYKDLTGVFARNTVMMDKSKSGFGITLRARATVENCHINKFPGHGFVVNSNGGANANLFKVSTLQIGNVAGHGFVTRGGDSNSGDISGVNAVNVGGYGVYDSSFLGNTYDACHVSSCLTGPYYSARNTNQSAFLGCYSEMLSPLQPFPSATSIIGKESTVVGGTHGAGISHEGQGFGLLSGRNFRLGNGIVLTENLDASGFVGKTLKVTGSGLTPSPITLSTTGVNGSMRGAALAYRCAYGSSSSTEMPLDMSDTVESGYLRVVQSGTIGSELQIDLVPLVSTTSYLTVTGGTPSKAAILYPIVTNGVVTSIQVTYAGEGYTSAPTIGGVGVFSGIQATAYIQDGKVSKVTVENGLIGLQNTTASRVLTVNSNAILPAVDNKTTVGSASLRVKEVFAATGTVNTSDEREKQQIRDLSDAEKRVAVKLKSQIKAFKFNDAVSKKGSAARIHFGVIAQEVKAAFESEGLVAEDYAILCYDEWEAEYREITEEITVTNDAGEEVTETVETGERELIREAGSRYGVRYEELLAFIISAI